VNERRWEIRECSCGKWEIHMDGRLLWTEESREQAEKALAVVKATLAGAKT
jgi:hypothetical protein